MRFYQWNFSSSFLKWLSSALKYFISVFKWIAELKIDSEQSTQRMAGERRTHGWNRSRGTWTTGSFPWNSLEADRRKFLQTSKALARHRSYLINQSTELRLTAVCRPCHCFKRHLDRFFGRPVIWDTHVYAKSFALSVTLKIVCRTFLLLPAANF